MNQITSKGGGITRKCHNISNTCYTNLKSIQPKHNNKSSTRYPCGKEVENKEESDSKISNNSQINHNINNFAKTDKLETCIKTCNKLGQIKVAIRVRPLSLTEAQRGDSNCILMDLKNQQIKINNKNTFTFNYVFGPENNQTDVYDRAVEKLVTQLSNGYNATIMAYGQTGSGKTYTMNTNLVDTENEKNWGITPRAIKTIFEELKIKQPEVKCAIRASFIELYQDHVYDLLSEKKAKLEIRGSYGTDIKLPNLTEMEVRDMTTALHCLVQGSKARVTGKTAMNSDSSRSHCIFTLKISQTKKDGNTITSVFRLVDLAGSENVNKTLTNGNVFKEGTSNNKTLLVLSRVITALRNKSNYIPYRESKLTRLLENSLGGNSLTLIIACVNPAIYNVDESLNTLRYANEASKIKNKPVVNEDPITAQLRQLTTENHELKLKIIELKTISTAAQSSIAYSKLLEQKSTNDLSEPENTIATLRKKCSDLEQIIKMKDKKYVELEKSMVMVTKKFFDKQQMINIQHEECIELEKRMKVVTTKLNTQITDAQHKFEQFKLELENRMKKANKLNTQIHDVQNKFKKIQLERNYEISAQNEYIRKQNNQLISKNEVNSSQQAHLKHWIDESEKTNKKQKTTLNVNEAEEKIVESSFFGRCLRKLNIKF